ncbi:hypothetical protein R5R35_009164 [Gryllus longicercus]|uniref:Serine palmitoyltransferase small subunit B n=1 Tax=Gryllus longicercus TaxID=2509291 RepID=A0AAN9VMN2_9ORTH
MIDKILKFLSYWYLQYELVTCLYVFEPWEKKLLNGIIVIIIALVSYSTYAYLPHYTVSLLSHFNLLNPETGDYQHQIAHVHGSSPRAY